MDSKCNAGFLKRFGAYMIDIIPIVLVASILMYFFTDFNRVIDNYLTNGTIESRVDFLMYRNLIRDASFCIWIVYSIICDATSLNGTLGKKVLKIKVVDEDGNTLSVKRSIIRNISKLLSMLILTIGFIMAGFTKHKQALHDKIAKTYVISS